MPTLIKPMNLQEKYQQEVIPALMEEFGLPNKMAAPRIKKIVVNIGIKEGAKDKGALEKATEQLRQITGQKPKISPAKKSIANFKIREGDPIGLTVTLRGKRMYDLLTKLVAIVLPRVRDFHGVPRRSFDGRGNYTLGFAEQIVFPEIDYAKIDRIRGLELTLVIEGSNAKISERLLELIGMPFEKK